MPPRFLERIQEQYAACEKVFGQHRNNPPPYACARQSYGSSHSLVSSGAASSFVSRYNRRRQDLPSPSPPPPYSLAGQAESAIGIVDAVALPRQSLILVTGASGWHSMHVIDQLLQQGYRVRGTVRTAEKAIWTGKYFREKYGAGKYMPVVIPDMVPKGAFELAVRGCSGVIHLASVMSKSSDPHEVITPTVAGALNALESAAEEAGIKRFVYCSALAAAMSKDSEPGDEVRSDSWNMAAFERAWSVGPPYDGVDKAWAVFSSSKMQAELAVWRWYRVHKPKFVLNTVLPATLSGGLLDPKNQDPSSFANQLKSMIGGDTTATARSPRPQRYFVDVQDSALLHVAALVLPDVEGQRIFAIGQKYDLDPTRGTPYRRSPKPLSQSDMSDHARDSTVFRDAPTAEALLRRLGRKQWTSIETSISRNRESLIRASPVSQGD